MLNPINHARTRIDMHRNRGSDLTQPDLQPMDRAVVLERDRERPRGHLDAIKFGRRFVDGLLDGSLGFGGEESAGASFIRLNGGPLCHASFMAAMIAVWTFLSCAATAAVSDNRRCRVS